MQGWFPEGIALFPFYGDECEAVDRWDGIGGHMVLASERRAVVNKPSGTGARKKAVGRGTAKMTAAAGETLEKNSDEIAKSLLESTLGGNASSAKLLFALAEGQIDCEDEVVMRRLCSFAESLASEPEWTDKAVEDAAERDFGTREPVA